MVGLLPVVFRGRSIAVVVPAFNEADKLANTIRSIPGFVDTVIVVDDASTDGTAAIARRLARRTSNGHGRRGLVVIEHPRNRGVGAAIASGYGRALDLGIDVTAVMAGDGQMDPADLSRLLLPVVSGAADYSKGNRFAWPGYWRAMPPHRLAGNIALSLLTRLASGYWDLFDSQCGYTAASRRALLAIDPARMFERYGYPNDLLGRLRTAGARVTDVPVRPVYGQNWRSGIRPLQVMVPISFVLLRSWLTRLGHAWRGRPRALAALEDPPWSSVS
jgi:glycosyltransferase involved in cell wall biosynthesis